MRNSASGKDLGSQAVTKLDQLEALLKAHDGHCWQIGDLVNEIVHSHRVPLIRICQRVAYSKPRLSELGLTAKAFAPEQRTKTNFQDSLMARRIFTRLPRLGMDLLEIRAQIAQMRGKRSSAIRVHFLEVMARRQATEALANPLTEDFASRCHRADWRAIVPTLPDKSIKIINADPPYSGYSWSESGGYISKRAEANGLRIDSDGNTTKEARLSMLDLFDLCLPKLQEGGCLLLWQAGARPDSPQLLEKAESVGWELPYALTWSKSKTAIADDDCPYAPTSERILVFVPRGTKLRKHEHGLSRADVLSFPSDTAASTKRILAGLLPVRSVHMFQKPLALMEHLIRKHSYPGEVILDCFGCSGSACIAAQKLERRWIYIEKNRENFEWGRQRIQEAAAQSSASERNSEALGALEKPVLA